MSDAGGSDPSEMDQLKAESEVGSQESIDPSKPMRSAHRARVCASCKASKVRCIGFESGGKCQRCERLGLCCERTSQSPRLGRVARQFVMPVSTSLPESDGGRGAGHASVSQHGTVGTSAGGALRQFVAPSFAVPPAPSARPSVTLCTTCPESSTRSVSTTDTRALAGVRVYKRVRECD